MSIEHIELLVEDASTETALRGILPRILCPVSFSIYPHLCKEDLLLALPGRLRGYAPWLPASWRIVVLLDRDDDDCHRLKQQMERIALGAGLVTRSAAASPMYSVVNRVAVQELEAWFFGDWMAVQAAYPRAPRGTVRRAPYRDPDGISGGAWEAIERILRRAGYFEGGFRKIEFARAVSVHMVPERNRSRSFQVFHAALQEMVDT